MFLNLQEKRMIGNLIKSYKSFMEFLHVIFLQYLCSKRKFTSKTDFKNSVYESIGFFYK